jgi:hypothetical protein
MFYENDSEKERVEGIMERLKDETFITVNPAFCGNCKAFATEKFEQAFGEEGEDIITVLCVYLYAQGEHSSKYNKFSLRTEDQRTKLEFYVLRKQGKIIFCTEEERMEYESL